MGSHGVILISGEETGSLITPTLRESKLGQTGQGLRVHDRLRAAGHLHSGLQLCLGTRPVANGEQDAAVMCAARRQEVRRAVTLSEIVCRANHWIARLMSVGTRAHDEMVRQLIRTTPSRSVSPASGPAIA